MYTQEIKSAQKYANIILCGLTFAIFMIDVLVSVSSDEIQMEPFSVYRIFFNTIALMNTVFYIMLAILHLQEKHKKSKLPKLPVTNPEQVWQYIERYSQVIPHRNRDDEFQVGDWVVPHAESRNVHLRMQHVNWAPGRIDAIDDNHFDSVGFRVVWEIDSEQMGRMVHADRWFASEDLIPYIFEYKNNHEARYLLDQEYSQ